MWIDSSRCKNRFGLLDMDVMPILIIIPLDIVITLLFSINCSTVICSPTILFAILREATSETYGPRVYLLSYLFPIYFYLHLYFLHLYYKIPKKYLSYLIILSDLTFASGREGLTTPLLRWLRVLCLFV